MVHHDRLFLLRWRHVGIDLAHVEGRHYDLFYFCFVWRPKVDGCLASCVRLDLAYFNVELVRLLKQLFETPFVIAGQLRHDDS